MKSHVQLYYSACVVSPLYIIVDTVLVHIQCIPVVSSIIRQRQNYIDLVY